MFTYPTGVKKILYNGSLQSLRRVPAQDWFNFCAIGDAQGFVKQLESMPSMAGFSFSVAANDPESASDYQYDDPGQPVQMWSTLGTAPSGRTLPILIGDLIDRETRPNMFLDIHNSDGTLGGPVLHLVDLGYAYELAWGK
jgi:hypothetical protein